MDLRSNDPSQCATFTEVLTHAARKYLNPEARKSTRANDEESFYVRGLGFGVWGLAFGGGERGGERAIEQ